MPGFFTESVNRTVDAANHITYIHGTLHPDRIMEEHDIVYMMEGEWEIWQNGAVYTVGPDDVILLHAGQHHYGLKPCTPNTKTMYIHCSAHEGDNWANVAEFTYPVGAICLPTVISCRRRMAIKRWFQEIIAANWCDSPRKEQKLAALLSLLLNELQECAVSGEAQDADDALREIVTLLQSNPERFFTEVELAKRCFLSERSLRERFRNAYGQSPYRYQLSAKLQMACEFMTTHPETQLHEVALNLGFHDEFHFGKRFKERYGVSPGKWRRGENS